MPFFTYTQNNSGGFYKGPHYVIIEADTDTDANAIAEADTPIYFGGVTKGLDCDCCGDRWYPAWSGEDGDDKPTIYGRDALLYSDDVVIVYADGRVVTGEGNN